MAKAIDKLKALRALLAGADPAEVFEFDGNEAGAIAYYDGQTYEIDGKHYTQAEYEAWERAKLRTGSNSMLIWHEELATPEQVASLPPQFPPEQAEPKVEQPKEVESVETKRARVMAGLAARRKKDEDKRKAKQKKLAPAQEAQVNYEFILGNMVSLRDHQEFNREINHSLRRY